MSVKFFKKLRLFIPEVTDIFYSDLINILIKDYTCKGKEGYLCKNTVLRTEKKSAGIFPGNYSEEKKEK
jgi:hypothetical protein